MGTSIVITPHVINTINSLPMEERLAVTAALAGEMILGGKAEKDLTPMQEMIFSLIKSYVNVSSTKIIKRVSTDYRKLFRGLSLVS